MEFSSLSELEALITNLITNQKCSCHFINPSKTRLLLWREIKDGQPIYHLKIGIQKFISHEQIDRNGGIYWRFGTPAPEAENPIQGEVVELPVTNHHDQNQPPTPSAE